MTTRRDILAAMTPDERVEWWRQLDKAQYTARREKAKRTTGRYAPKYLGHKIGQTHRFNATVWPQPNACELCGTVTDQLNRDHCHNGQHFRGWLCISCNTRLGRIELEAEWFKRVVVYLGWCCDRSDAPEQLGASTLPIE